MREDPRAFVAEAHGCAPDEILSVRYDEAERCVYAVTVHGQKLRVTGDGSVDVLVGPRVPTPDVEIAAPLAPVETDEDVLRPLEPPGELEEIVMEGEVLHPLPREDLADRYEIFPGKDGWYVRRVDGHNGQTELVSEAYTRKATALRRARDLAGPESLEVVVLDAGA